MQGKNGFEKWEAVFSFWAKKLKLDPWVSYITLKVLK
jgi:hypothetical protein